MNYVIKNTEAGLFLGVSQTTQHYEIVWSSLENAIQFSSEQKALDYSVFQGYDFLLGADFSVITLSEATSVKKSPLGFFARLFCIGLILLSGVCEKNYTNALNAASLCRGGDSDIKAAMREYGFNVDPLADAEPTMADKVVALYVSQF